MYCYHCMNLIRDGELFCPYCGKSTKLEDIPYHLRPGTVLQNKYLIGKSIGSGGFGITYVGLDINLKLKIAVKEFYPHGYANRNSKVTNRVTLNYQNEGEYFKNGKEQFLREAQSLAKFSKESGIVDVRDFFTENDTAYIIMEYVDGYTLSERIKQKGQIPPSQMFSLMLPIMRSLERMHRENIIHRDISPDNIKVTEDGSLKLMDFGSARYFAGAQKKTMSVLLKPGFAPYEQYNSEGNQGPWTDVYGLCATMYKCITGKTPSDSLNRTQRDPLKKPSDLGVMISDSLQNILMYGLAIYPENRCPDMTRLIELTESALRNETVLVTGSSSAEEDIYRTQKADEQYKTMFTGRTYQDPSHIQTSGTSLNSQPYAAPQKKNNTGLIIALIIVSFLIAAATAAVIALFLSNDKNVSDSVETTASVTETTKEEEKTEVKEESKDESSEDDGNETVTMTDVSGKKLSDATAELERLGLKVDTQFEERSEVAEGYVIRQSIQPERQVNKGDTIMLYVAKKPENEEVNNYVEEIVDDASYFSGASASSVLPDQQGFNYSPQNVLSDDSSCWVEDSSGLGIGEWIKLDLPEKQRVNGLRIINGYAGTEKQYSYNSKIKTLKIEFSDGQSTTVSLKVFPASQRRTVQVITLSQPVVTNYVKLTIMDAVAGDCPDTCLTFVSPY